MSGKFLQEVKNQYENYPYPRRDPEDEKKRIMKTTMDSLDLVNHVCFAGKKDFRKGFRALVAGGGTGDAAIYLAEQLREADCEIIYIDLSQASMDIAQKRAEIRNLSHKIKFINGSLLEVPEMGLGKFDYINCSGVLHHLASPADGLQALKNVLKDDGAMAIMVYAKYGRTGLYEMQDLMRLLNKDIKEPQEKVDIAKKMLHNLPKTNWFRKNFASFRTDIELFGDIGIYDICLHSQDRCYTVPELYEWVGGCGLELLTFHEMNGLHKMRYDPLSYTKDPQLLEQFKKMSPRELQAAGEIINGEIKKHCFYASPMKRQLPSIDDWGNVPFLSSVIFDDGIYQKISDHTRNNPSYEHESFTVKISIDCNKLTPYIFKYFDGERTIKQIIEAVVADRGLAGQDIKPQAVFEEFARIYKQFNAFDWMLLRDSSIPNTIKSTNRMQSYLKRRAA